ncbi:hypothetical protein [Candidatus Poriferisodalis sp.]|uniref:hypothetical protein n=1 Tax=Candidatus Poriferisodalis sp. TaxID=3101277 RepID=UPI003D0ECCB5
MLLLLLAAQAFLVAGARAQADAAASEGLRAVWEAVGDAGLAYADDGSLHTGSEPHPRAAVMSAAAHDAVAQAASGSAGGWRWWTPGTVTVRSDWCHSGVRSVLRPGPGEPGWVRVTVSGDVFGPFSALWPGRQDRVHAAAAGPAVLVPPAASESIGVDDGGLPSVPVDLPEC